MLRRLVAPASRRLYSTHHNATRGSSSYSSNNKDNAFISTTNPPASSAESQTSGPLTGLDIAIKDNICTLDYPTTCGSALLSNYQSHFDATAVALLRAAGASISGKTNMDEFGMGSHSINSAFGPVRGTDGLRSAGGSSGGSAVAVAHGVCHAALGTDTGGSVRLPASYCGVYGFKPSYGIISRWGVVAYANSLDTVGILGREIQVVEDIFGVLNVHDTKDPTNLGVYTREKMEALTQRPSKTLLRFGVPEQYNTAELSKSVRQTWMKTVGYLKELGHTVHSVSLPTTQQALSAYYILAPAEASSNLAKYDGVRYGQAADRDDEDRAAPLYSATRQQGFGPEVRRRILLGSYSLSADAIDNYFLKAQKIRRLVQKDFNQVFRLPNVLGGNSEEAVSANEGVDALICPTAPDEPPLLQDVATQAPLEAYAGDVFTIPASLAGLPALNVPVKASSDSGDRPGAIGMQVITQYGDDHTALQVGKLLEELR